MERFASFRSLIKSGIYEIKSNGLRSFVYSAIRFFHYNVYLNHRDKLPPNLSKEQIKNGVRVKNEDAKLLDTIVGFPFHENNEIEYIQEYVESGDTVVDVGGGIGVSTIWCAQKAGKEGVVHVYEASSTSIEQLETTLDINPVDAIVNLNHAIIGKKGGQVRFDEGEEADIVSPKDLPECDVLNMDCEGAELTILTDMTIYPRIILVETHGQYDSSGRKITRILEEKGYEVIETRGDLDGLAQLAARRINSDI
jgi:hypothetical protein